MRVLDEATRTSTNAPIYVTHHADDAETLAERAMTLFEGRLDETERPWIR